jgi:hypothetical protein
MLGLIEKQLFILGYSIDSYIHDGCLVRKVKTREEKDSHKEDCDNEENDNCSILHNLLNEGTFDDESELQPLDTSALRAC